MELPSTDKPQIVSEVEKNPQKDSMLKSNWVIYLIISLAIFITFGAWLYASNTINRQARDQFEKESLNVTEMIQNRIDTYINASYGIKALFAASDQVEREEFNTYVKELGLRERYPGLVAVYYAERVSADSFDTFSKAIKKEGYPDFKIQTTSKEEAYVINYIEPYSLYKDAFGRDAAADTARTKALIEARDSGKPVITERVTLQNAEQTERAFIVFFPVYDTNKPTYTVKERQLAIKGYIGAVFNGTSFFQSVIGDTLGRDRIGLGIYDNKTPTENHLFYKNTLFFDESSTGKFDFKKTAIIPVAGNTWTLEFVTLKNFSLPRVQEFFPVLVLIAGIIFVSLLFISLYTLSTGKERALAIVDKMTSDLRIFEDIVKNMTEGLLIFRLNKTAETNSFKLALANPVSEEQLKETPEAIIVDKELYELFPHLQEKNIRAEYTKVLQTKQKFEYEDTRTTKNGLRTFLTRVFPMPNDSVGSMYMDITDQKNTQETLRTHSEELQKLNSFMVDREVKMVELKKEIASLKGATEPSA